MSTEIILDRKNFIKILMKIIRFIENERILDTIKYPVQYFKIPCGLSFFTDKNKRNIATQNLIIFIIHKEKPLQNTTYWVNRLLSPDNII